MQWIDHHKLDGQHAFLGASKPQWTKWDEELIVKRFNNSHAADVGTAIHALAKDLIKSRTRINLGDKNLINLAVYRSVPKAYPNGFDSDTILKTLVPYVNDAIGFHMDPEIILYYSDNCFGTTDAIQYYEKEHILRNHDLKTGVLPVHEEQLFIYNALFCLEYNKDPKGITFLDRFYQNGEIKEINPSSKEIKKFMDLIINDNSVIEKFLKTYMEAN